MHGSDKKIKLCIVITVSLNLQSLYRDQFSYLSCNGFDVTAIASPGPEHDFVRKQGAKTVEIKIERTPSFFADFISFVKLWWFFLFNRFDLISVSTPKASLLGSLAARLAFQSRVVYMVRGRAYENMTGKKRFFYEFIDKLVCALSFKVHSISKELAIEYIDSGICPASKMVVLGEGSSNGVDLNRFCPDNYSPDSIRLRRQSLGIPDESFVFFYCGRIRKDKGVVELVGAFDLLRKRADVGDVFLLIQGEYEAFDPLPKLVLDKLGSDPGIISLGWSGNVEDYFSIADVFVFPSYREGFGNVAIEASAMKLPVLAFDVVGCRESVKNGVSGMLSEPKSVEALSDNMYALFKDRKLLSDLGLGGYERVRQHFASEVVWARLVKFYREVSR